MSQLRVSIEAARATYRAETYPGDLAADVLGGTEDARDRRSWVIGTSALSGLAAAVVVAALLLPGTTRRVAQWAGVSSPTRSFNLDLPALPSLPAGPELAYRRAGELLHGAVPTLQIRAVGESVRSIVEQLTTA